MQPGLGAKKLDWAASPPEASGGDVAFCAPGFCANPVTLVSAVMSAFAWKHRLTRGSGLCCHRACAISVPTTRPRWGE